MLIYSNMKKTVMAAALAFAMMPSPASACNPINPICLFKMVLKTTPGLPVVDPGSISAIIPHVPAALTKEGQEFPALEGFPAFDSEDPMEIAKAIEVLYLRPGWQEGKDSPLTTYDKSLMDYYREQFQLNNIVEAVGTYTVLEAKINELMATAETVQKKLDGADDLNKAQRANFEAQLLEYQLQIVYNQLLATQLQMKSVSQLSVIRPVLNEPILSKM